MPNHSNKTIHAASTSNTQDINTHSVFFPKINAHSGDCALSNLTVLGPGGGEGEKAGEGESRTKFE